MRRNCYRYCHCYLPDLLTCLCASVLRVGQLPDSPVSQLQQFILPQSLQGMVVEQHHLWPQAVQSQCGGRQYSNRQYSSSTALEPPLHELYLVNNCSTRPTEHTQKSGMIALISNCSLYIISRWVSPDSTPKSGMQSSFERQRDRSGRAAACWASVAVRRSIEVGNGGSKHYNHLN